MRVSEARADNHCFGCGGGNVHGLRLVFEVDDDEPRARGRFRLGQEWQGAPGLAHGGIVAAILDEAMSKLNHGVAAMTAELHIEYRKPIPLGDEIVVEAFCRSRSGRNRLLAGEIRNVAGEVLARGEGRFVELGAARAKIMAEEISARTGGLEK
jgi:acyl-coenzyme A thioesterase PaaI-like protein